MFDEINHVVVANKVDIKDDKKLKTLKSNFDNLHTVSLTERKGLDKLRNNIFSLNRLS